MVRPTLCCPPNLPSRVSTRPTFVGPAAGRVAFPPVLSPFPAPLHNLAPARSALVCQGSGGRCRVARPFVFVRLLPVLPWRSYPAVAPLDAARPLLAIGLNARRVRPLAPDVATPDAGGRSHAS